MTGRPRRSTVALGRFLTAIGDLIATMPARELRAVVLAFAESVEASERQAFLERFGAGPAPPVEPIDTLLADVELLEEEAESTGEPGWDDYDDYHDRYGWSFDDEFRQPDWVPSLVELLRRTGAVFLKGDPSAAAQAYERLFRVVEGAQENGWSVAAEPGETAVVKEAAARYLRAVGELGHRGDRPDRLRRAATLLGRALIGEGVSYAAVEGARVVAPAEREMLLEDWASALTPLVEREDHYYGDWAHGLLLEVIERMDGVPGLAQLARAGGRRSGRNFLAWFDAARRQNDDVAALMAGEDGLRSLQPSVERAALAERVAVMAHGAGRLEDAVVARVEAWESMPSLSRLLNIVTAARRANVEEATITELAKRRPRSGVPAPLRVVLLAIGGRLETALKEENRKRPAATADKPLRSSQASLGAEVTATEVLIPILLAAGADATRRDGFAESVIAGLLSAAEAKVDRSHSGASFLYEFEEDDEDGTPGLARNVDQDRNPDLSLGELLLKMLEDIVVTNAKRTLYLEAGGTLASDAVTRIVGNKDRRRYSQAAALAIAHAEAISITKGEPAGEVAVEFAQSRYPRHTAYRAELRSTWTRSPFLTPPGRSR
jgi:hypothetical protein